MISLLLAAVILVPVLVTWASTPSYAVAFSGLSETDAGQITQQLDQSAIPYQLKGTGTILVPSSQVYSARLKMASAGLPKSSVVGFELFDQNTLGMTQFTQQVDYLRATEGELERTIGSLDAVDSVRVQIVTPEKTLLATDQAPATAAVTIKVKSNSQMDSNQVQAITHLVASSVEGLKPENVVVVDTDGNMLAGGSTGGSIVSSQTDSQRAAETAAAADVRKRVQDMLIQILGPDKSTVQAAVSMDWTQRDVTSNVYNPTPQALRSSQKVNETSSSNGSAIGGIPGAASNLPTPVATVAGGSGASTYTHSEETLNYEISQTQTHDIVAPGQIQRVSVSVMLDNITDPKQLSTIKAAVVAAAGIDTTRGDQVVVETMPFDHTYYTAQAASMAKDQQTNLYTQIGIAAAAFLLVVFLIFYFTRLFRNLRQASKESWVSIMKPVSDLAALQSSSASSLPHPALSAPAQNAIAGLAAAVEKQEIKPFDVRPARRQSDLEDEQRNKVITRLSEENPATVAEIIQLWLNEDSNNHG
jgi:flagellar M-ring protein FliF